MRLFFILTLLVPTLLLAGLALPGVGSSTGSTAPAASSFDSTQESCLACLAVCMDTGDGSCERICGCSRTATGVAQ